VLQFVNKYTHALGVKYSDRFETVLEAVEWVKAYHQTLSKIGAFVDSIDPILYELNESVIIDDGELNIYMNEEGVFTYQLKNGMICNVKELV
jgi:hypothetical protein